MEMTQTTINQERQMRPIHKMKYYLSIKKTPTQTTKWANLESIVLNEKSQPKETRNHMIPIIQNSKNGKTREIEGRFSGY